jgi:hypothetical protein
MTSWGSSQGRHLFAMPFPAGPLYSSTAHGPTSWPPEAKGSPAILHLGGRPLRAKTQNEDALFSAPRHFAWFFSQLGRYSPLAPLCAPPFLVSRGEDSLGQSSQAAGRSGRNGASLGQSPWKRRGSLARAGPGKAGFQEPGRQKPGPGDVGEDGPPVWPPSGQAASWRACRRRHLKKLDILMTI